MELLRSMHHRVVLVPTSDGLWAVDPAAARLTPVTALDLTRPLADVAFDGSPARRLGDGSPARRLGDGGPAWTAAPTRARSTSINRSSRIAAAVDPRRT